MNSDERMRALRAAITEIRAENPRWNFQRVWNKTREVHSELCGELRQPIDRPGWTSPGSNAASASSTIVRASQPDDDPWEDLGDGTIYNVYSGDVILGRRA